MTQGLMDKADSLNRLSFGNRLLAMFVIRREVPNTVKLYKIEDPQKKEVLKKMQLEYRSARLCTDSTSLPLAEE